MQIGLVGLGRMGMNMGRRWCLVCGALPKPMPYWPKKATIGSIFQENDLDFGR